MFNHNKPDEGPPCAHMESLLQQLSDGSLKGLRRWYAVAHAARCYRCGSFLKRMTSTVAAIRASKHQLPPADVQARLEDLIRKTGAK